MMVAQARVLDMSRPVDRGYDNARRCPGSHQLRQAYLEIPLRKGIREEAHKGLLADGADDAFRLFVRLGLALGTLWRVLVGVAFAFLLGPGALCTISTGIRVENWKQCRTFPISR